MSFSSNLPFFSFLQYSPTGLGALGESSKVVRSAIKSDGLVTFRRGDGSSIQINAIDAYVARLAREVANFDFLAKCFGRDVTLVPIPRSSPLSSRDALWPTHRICRAMLAHGLAGDISPLLERHVPVQKSAYAQPGQRPSPHAHFSSTRVVARTTILTGRRITLVDDFITRGSTFVGMLPHIQMEFETHEIFCFALVRTESYQPVEKIIAPVAGNITFNGTQLRRTP